ncbi:unnamed protein product, partial [Nesidiocoris tenuis]
MKSLPAALIKVGSQSVIWNNPSYTLGVDTILGFHKTAAARTPPSYMDIFVCKTRKT